MLDYKLIEALARVVYAGGFDKAAREMNITQSAVSQRIKLLEEQYGRILLQRTSPPQPTESGSILLNHYTRVKQLEEDLEIQRRDDDTNFITLSLGINADSLATWFHKAAGDVIKEEQIILDLHVDDQDNTHELLKTGVVWGCISSQKTPLQGCRTIHLGAMTYGVFAEKSFYDVHFSDGFCQDACGKIPMARFNRKDELNEKMFQKTFPESTINPPCFYIPSSEKYAEFILAGHCYGILPTIQVEQMDKKGNLVNINPSHQIDVHLYWHCWTLKSKTMEIFDRKFTQAAQKILSSKLAR